MIAVLIGGAVSMFLSLFGTRWMIGFFATLGMGQPILGSEDHGPVHHMKKQGTATMGGLAIVGAGFLGWLVAHARREPSREPPHLRAAPQGGAPRGPGAPSPCPPRP